MSLILFIILSPSVSSLRSSLICLFFAVLRCVSYPFFILGFFHSFFSWRSLLLSLSPLFLRLFFILLFPSLFLSPLSLVILVLVQILCFTFLLQTFILIFLFCYYLFLVSSFSRLFCITFHFRPLSSSYLSLFSFFPSFPLFIICFSIHFPPFPYSILPLLPFLSYSFIFSLLCYLNLLFLLYSFYSFFLSLPSMQRTLTGFLSTSNFLTLPSFLSPLFTPLSPLPSSSFSSQVTPSDSADKLLPLNPLIMTV